MSVDRWGTKKWIYFDLMKFYCMTKNWITCQNCQYIVTYPNQVTEIKIGIKC